MTLPPAEFRRELDKMRSEALLRSASDRSQRVIDIALLGMRSLTLINGGAMIALLTFLGHFTDFESRAGLALSFAYFATGLTCSLLTILCAYAAQHFFHWQDDFGAHKIFFGSYGAPKKEAEMDRGEDVFMALGTAAQFGAVQFAMLSMALFIVGCFDALFALTR